MNNRNNYHQNPGVDPSASASADASAFAAALALQLQGQGQGQGQDQEQSSVSENLNLNGNGNFNGNLNESYSDNSNANSNSNSNTSHTDVKVNVGVDLEGYLPTDDDFADLDLHGNTFDNIFITESGSINFDPGNDVNFQNVLNGAFSGGGSDTGFALSQVVDLVDNDTLSGVTQTNSGIVTLTATGGTASAGDGIGTDDGGWGGMDHSFFGGGNGGSGGSGDIDAGDDVSGSSAASAAANLTSTAFTQEIVLGANLQQNAFEATVINGSYTHTSNGDTDAV